MFVHAALESCILFSIHILAHLPFQTSAWIKLCFIKSTPTAKKTIERDTISRIAAKKIINIFLGISLGSVPNEYIIIRVEFLPIG
jgi:hypothetical protein